MRPELSVGGKVLRVPQRGGHPRVRGRWKRSRLLGDASVTVRYKMSGRVCRFCPGMCYLRV